MFLCCYLNKFTLLFCRVQQRDALNCLEHMLQVSFKRVSHVQYDFLKCVLHVQHVSLKSLLHVQNQCLKCGLHVQHDCS